MSGCNRPWLRTLGLTLLALLAVATLLNGLLHAWLAHGGDMYLRLNEYGYFRTGDMATQAADGRVSLVGRAKDLIISGGLNVYPKEIETEIDAVPGVGESAVIGVPHPDFGEAVVAVVTRTDDSVEEDTILRALDGRLARFKRPKRVVFV